MGWVLFSSEIEYWGRIEGLPDFVFLVFAYWQNTKVTAIDIFKSLITEKSFIDNSNVGKINYR